MHPVWPWEQGASVLVRAAAQMSHVCELVHDASSFRLGALLCALPALLWRSFESRDAWGRSFRVKSPYVRRASFLDDSGHLPLGGALEPHGLVTRSTQVGSVAHVRMIASKLNSKLSGLRPVGLLLGRSCRAPTASASLPDSASPAACLCRWVFACVGAGALVNWCA